MINPYSQPTKIPFGLFDDSTDIPKDKIMGLAEFSPSGLCLRFKGHGTQVEDGDMGGIIWIEFYEGKVRCHCWNDINEEEAQVIEFEDARVEKREKEWEG